MSPAKFMGKSKDRSSRTPTPKQQQRSSSQSITSSDGDPPSRGSGCSPISGAIHILETIRISCPAEQNDGPSRNIDERNDHSLSSPCTMSEYDTVSNGSISGESEDTKEKSSPTLRQEAGPGNDTEKREKNRQKNEKKHQRQKERRAQELHERCCGYMMSRKLEGLSQQLVAMGFSSERATLALILNEGKLEKSVTWLFDVSEEEAQRRGASVENASNLKIDISQECGEIAVMEAEYRISKQEVERAVVSCEGDLDKAEEILKVQKPSPPKMGVMESQGMENLAKQQERPTSAPIMIPKTVGQPMKTGSTLILPRDPTSNRSSQLRLIDKGWVPSSYESIAREDEDRFDMSRKEVVQRAVPDQVKIMQHLKPLNFRPRFFMHRNGLYPTRTGCHVDVTASGSMPADQFYSYADKCTLPVAFNLSEGMGEELLRPMVHHPVSPLTNPSSLGLFPGGSAERMDWNMGSSMEDCDYARIDWSVRPNSSCLERNDLLLGLSSYLKEGERDGGLMLETASPPSENDWTSSFTGNDMFSVPRQFATSSL